MTDDHQRTGTSLSGTRRRLLSPLSALPPPSHRTAPVTHIIPSVGLHGEHTVDGLAHFSRKVIGRVEDRPRQRVDLLFFGIDIRKS